MKKTTCKELRGACDTEILGATPEEMAENAKMHAMEMFQKLDPAHLEAMAAMKSLSHEDQMKWFQEFKDNFDSLQDA